MQTLHLAADQLSDADAAALVHDDQQLNEWVVEAAKSARDFDAGLFRAMVEAAAMVPLPLPVLTPEMAGTSRTGPRRLPPLRAEVRGVPGRKLSQIRALASLLPPSDDPVVDWCGGKGHLARELVR